MNDFILLHDKKDGKEIVLRSKDIVAIYEIEDGSLICREDKRVDNEVTERPHTICAKLNMERCFVTKDGKIERT